MVLVYNLDAFDALMLETVAYLDAEILDFPPSAPGGLIDQHRSALGRIRRDYLTKPHYRCTPTGNYGGQPRSHLTDLSTSLEGR